MLGAILLVFFIFKRRRASKDDSKPNIEPARTAQFDNPVYLGDPNLRIVKPFDNPLYGVVEQEPQKRAEDNEYSLVDEPMLDASSEDGPEGLNEDVMDFKTKDSTKDFEKNTLTFTNPGFQ